MGRRKLQRHSLRKDHRIATEPFTDEEREDFLSLVSGQNSDGLGEGFEQRPIEIRDGELYVHLWQPGDDYFLCTKDQIPIDQADGQEMGMKI